MALVPYSNTTTRHQHVAGKTIKPGETRMVDERLLPTSGPAMATATSDAAGIYTHPAADLILEDIQALTVAQLREALQGLSTEQLERLGELEANSEAPRTTALEAIQHELAQREGEGEAGDR